MSSSLTASVSRPLVIFGLRGTLLERLHTSKVPPSLSTAAQFSVGLHKVWLRPHALETLAAISDHCDVGIWSSTTAKNTTPLMDAVFSELPKPFRFVWTREHTTTDDFRRLMASQRDDEHATLKDLNKVVSAFPEYGLEKIVLVDDTPSKARVHAGNFVWLQSYNEENLTSDKALLELKDFILRDIVGAADVRKVLPKHI